MSALQRNRVEQSPSVHSTVQASPQNMDTTTLASPVTYPTPTYTSGVAIPGAQQGPTGAWTAGVGIPTAQQGITTGPIYGNTVHPAVLGTQHGQVVFTQQPMFVPGYLNQGGHVNASKIAKVDSSNKAAIKTLGSFIILLSLSSIAMESTSMAFSSRTSTISSIAAPGIWAGLWGVICGSVVISAAGGERSEAGAACSTIYMLVLAVQMIMTSVTVTSLSGCLGGNVDTNSCLTFSGFWSVPSIGILQIAILCSGGLQGFLMLFVSGFICTRACCPKRVPQPNNMLYPYGRMMTVPIQPGVVTLNETNGPGATSEQTGGPDAHIPALSDRATVAKLPGRHVAKRSPKDFGIFAQNFQEKSTGEQVRTVARYISNSPDDLALVLSADDTDDYSSGKKNGGDLMLALREKGIIFRASDDVWYYDELARIFVALGLRALKEELMTEMSDKAPATKPETGQDMDAKLLMKELAETLKLNAENAAMAAGQGASGRPSQDNRAVKTKIGTFVAHKDPSNFGVFVDHFNGRVTDVQTKKMAKCVFLLNEGDFDLQVQVLTALELSELESGDRKGGYLLEKLLGKGLIFKGSDGTFYYDGLAKVLKAIGEIELLNEMLDEKTNNIEAVQGTDAIAEDVSAVSNQVQGAGSTSLAVFVSKEFPTNYPKFAFQFSELVSQERLVKMADNLFFSGEKMFGCRILTTEYREQFQSGSKNGAHLLDKLKEGGAISKGPDGIFNYDGLARILDAVDARGLKNELLVKSTLSELEAVGVTSMATLLATGTDKGATWKTEIHIARESPGDFGMFVNSFSRNVLEEEVAQMAHFIFHSNSEFHLQILTADELQLFEKGKKSSGKLLEKLKARGIIYKGSDDLYYYDGLLIILAAVKAHGLINRLLVKKNGDDPDIPRKSQKQTDQETSANGGSVISRTAPTDFGLFAKAFADRMSQVQTVELARYVFHAKETTSSNGVQILAADELEEFENGVKKADHLISILKDRGVIFRDDEAILYYDKLAQLLDKVQLQHVSAALLRNTAHDADSVNTRMCVIAKESAKSFSIFTEKFNRKIKKGEVKRLAGFLFKAGELEFQRIILTADEHTDYERGRKDGASLVTKLRERGVIVSDAEGLFYYDGLARVLRAVGLQKISRDLLDLPPESDDSSSAGSDDTITEPQQPVDTGITPEVWVSSAVPDDFPAFCIHFGRCVNPEQLRDQADYLSNTSQLGDATTPVLNEVEYNEFLQKTKTGADLLKILKQKHIIYRREDGLFCYDGLVKILENLGQTNIKRSLFTQIDPSEHHRRISRTISVEPATGGKWTALADKHDFAAFRIRFNSEVSEEAVYQIATYLCYVGEEEGFHSAPIVNPDELPEYHSKKSGRKTGADLLKGMKDRGMIYKGRNRIFYYDELVHVLEVVKLNDLVSKLLVREPTEVK